MRRRSVHFESIPRILPGGGEKAHEPPPIPEKKEEECPSKEDNDTHLGSNLKDVEPELRRSLTNLTFTPIQDPTENMEVLKSKLVGRDELEIYRLKKQQRMRRENGEDS